MTPEQNARLATLMLDNLHGITNALRGFARRMDEASTLAVEEGAMPRVALMFTEQANEARNLADKIDAIANEE